MKRNLVYAIAVILLVTISIRSFAVPASPYPVTITQPDGTTLTVILKGDEFHHYHTTEDGFLIVKDKEGIFNYAKVDNQGQKINTRVKANNSTSRSASEKQFVKSLPSNIDFSEANLAARKMRAQASVPASASIPASSKFPNVGSPRALVILVNFNDLNFVTPNPQAAFNDKLNKEGYNENGAIGSARDYFNDNSMGVFAPQFDVVGPYKLPNSYIHYGGNSTDGNDLRPVQMIVDACTAASADGVDFSIYDTDNDSFVDNIFVYYAGHNEAENGGADKVWPHRWAIYPTFQYSGGNYSGTVESITFNGKRIMDYACTSELRSSSGTEMAGIGTFTHEFGHVIGLADMYATNGAKHHTLSNWNIMDGGAYLNKGKTPPAYNSFERFQLGFLQPKLLTNPQNVVINPLITSNNAFIITQTEEFNQNPDNPQPLEFFLLENRQKVSWDAYLPGHGMLIYRINYDANDWMYNQPNNDPAKMGVDIMEADGIGSSSSLGGDPFPGTSNIQSYIPVLRNGTKLNDQSITFIEETNGVIAFRFKGGSGAPLLVASNSFKHFETVQGTPSEVQDIEISGRRLLNDMMLSFTNDEHFEIKLQSAPETMWAKTLSLAPDTDSIVNPVLVSIRYNPTVPSYLMSHSTNLIIESQLAEKIQLPINAKSSRRVYVVSPLANEGKDVTYESFTATWNEVMDNDKPAAGYYLTVTQAGIDGNETKIVDNKWLNTNSEILNNLISDRDYFFKVKASDKNTTYSYENITDFSNTIKVRTLAYPFEKQLRAVVQLDESVKVFVPAEVVGNGEIYVFNAMGQRLRSIKADSDIVDISHLPKNIILIIQAGKQRTKVIIN